MFYLASVLQKIGIESELVVKPGHMFVLFFTQPNRKGFLALETTLLGQIDLPHDARNKSLNVLDPKWRTNASAVSFEAAVTTGAEEISKLEESIQKQRMTILRSLWRFHFHFGCKKGRHNADSV